MPDFYRLATDDEDLPDDGLLAVTMQEPYEKPRIRLVPVVVDWGSAAWAGRQGGTADEVKAAALGGADA